MMDIMLGVIILGLCIVVGTLILIHILILIPISLLSNLPFSTLFFIVGIISFLFSLIVISILTYLSIHPDESHKRRKSFILDRKEIRRSIAITFTILYILLLTFYFREVEYATYATSAVKTFMNETVINVTANSSYSTITIINNTTNLTGNGLTGEGLTQHNSLISAFTALYAVIIGFYFGSRAYEKIKELKDADEVLKIQYIMDEIGKDEFTEKRGVLRGLKPNAQLVLLKPIISTEKKITIKHNGGDAIYLKDIMVIIKVKKLKTKFGLAPSDSEKDDFKVTEEMVIDMETGKETITVDGIDIKKNDLSDDGVAEVWNLNEEVEVNVVYKPTNEIISPMEKETITLK
jgi:hypothetical protein